MDFLHDTIALPGALGRGWATQHSRSDSLASDNTTSTAESNHPAGLLGPLRRLLRASRANLRGDAASPRPPETPPNPTDERPENTGYRIQALKVRLAQADKYSDWLAAATELDELEGNNAWKLDEASLEYDVELVRSRLKQMDATRISRDQKKMFMLVRTGLTRNLGGMGNQRLYKHSHLGTKSLIERYIESVLETIESLVDITKNGHGPLEPATVLQELLLTRQAFGRSALLLSGGGTFGMNHIGVVKCLFDANLLPRIISGASAGSIVSSVLCTKTDDEIPEVMKTFCYGDLAVFEKAGQETNLISKAFRFMTTGSLFDINNLINVMKNLLGDMTFQEAHNRTRRILNICVSNASLYELPRLLNYITAPNVIIWSAVAASCSVPLVFDPGQLLTRNAKTGAYEPWDESSTKYIDGSVENDIPTQRLAEMFNVNHFIVSQVNPHVVPFLEKDENDIAKEAQNHECGQTFGATLAQKMTMLAKEEAMHRLQMIQELGILPNVISKLRAVVGQRYAGDITIFPQISYSNFPYILANPTSDFMVAATSSGERATWPKLSEIRNHCAIELAIDDAVHQLMSSVAFGPCQLDNHSLNALGFAITDSTQRLRAQTRRPKYRTLRTSLDLPRLGMKTQRSDYGKPVGATAGSLGFSFTLGDGSNPFTAQKEAGPDVHDFSHSESGSDIDDEDTWDMSDDDSTDDSLRESPPSPNPSYWPSARQLFPWASQPSTPSFATRNSLSMAPLSKIDTPLANGAVPQPDPVPEPSEAELRYKRIFHHGAGVIKPLEPITSPGTLQSRSKSVVDLDVSGTRGMMRRRKTSFGMASRPPHV